VRVTDVVEVVVLVAVDEPVGDIPELIDDVLVTVVVAVDE